MNTDLPGSLLDKELGLNPPLGSRDPASLNLRVHEQIQWPLKSAGAVFLTLTRWGSGHGGLKPLQTLSPMARGRTWVLTLGWTLVSATDQPCDCRVAAAQLPYHRPHNVVPSGRATLQPVGSLHRQGLWRREDTSDKDVGESKGTLVQWAAMSLNYSPSASGVEIPYLCVYIFTKYVYPSTFNNRLLSIYILLD